MACPATWSGKSLVQRLGMLTGNLVSSGSSTSTICTLVDSDLVLLIDDATVA